MFIVAFIAAIAAIIIACDLNSKRKHLIVESDDAKRKAKAPSAKPSNNTNTVTNIGIDQVPSNQKSLNAILYIGCFMVVSSMIGFVSYFNQDLVPPITILVTIFTLIASLLLRAFVPFLKSSSFAFNISSIIMFVFWFPSFSALGFTGEPMVVTVFAIALIASIVSALVFKIRSVWHLPFFVGVGFFASLFFALGSFIEKANPDISEYFFFYGLSLIYMIVAIVCRLIWRKRINIPVAMRSAVSNSSALYFGATILTALISFVAISNSYFAASFAVLLMIPFYIVDHIYYKNRVPVIRILVQIFILVSSIYFADLLQADDETKVFIVLVAIAASAILQTIISICMMLKSPTEKTHASERIIVALSIAALALVGIIVETYIQESIYYNNRAAICEIHTSYNCPSAQTSNFLEVAYPVLEILSLVIGAVLSVVLVFLDRCAFMIFPAFLFIASSLTTEQLDNPLFSGIILGILSLIAAFSYFVIRIAEEKAAMKASLTSCISLAILSLIYCADSGHGYWVPVLVAGVIFCIFGAVAKNRKTTDWGYYISFFALALFFGDLASMIDNRTSEVLLNLLAWITVPLSVIALNFVHDLKSGDRNKETLGFILGSIAYWCITEFFGLYLLFAPNEGLAIAINSIIFIFEVLILIYAIYKHNTAMQVIATIVIVLRVVRSLGLNWWGILLLVGLSLIAFAIVAIYRASKKADLAAPNQPAAPTAPEQPKIEPAKTNNESESKADNSEPKAEPKAESTKAETSESKNTDIQYEKTEDKDKKTLA